MRINTNVNALVAYKNLNGINSSLSDSMSKLSTGFRINRAADDAAGLGIANKLRAENRALGQASRNAEQANSVLQIAEGATSSIQKALERMKELATQAGSDSVDAEGRGRINSEFNALRSEITRTVETTKFQGNALLDGTFGSLPAQLETADIDVGAAATAGTYSVSANSAGVVTLTRGSTTVGTVDLADSANNVTASSSFASGVLSLTFGSGTSAITLDVDASSATDAASAMEALNGKGFAVTGASGSGSPTSPAATANAAVPDLATDYSATNETFQIAVDGAAAATITLDGDYSAAAPAAQTSAATATAADRSVTSVDFDVTIDGGAATTITLTGNHTTVADMVAEINTELGTAGITTLSVAEGTGADVGKLVWTSTGAGAGSSFAVTDTDSVLGGNVGGSGTGGISSMVSAINTKLSAASISTVTVAAGSGADAGKLVWSHSGTGTASSFEITDSSGGALGGNIALTAGTAGAVPASLTSASITGNGTDRVAKFLVGASGAYQTDDTISLAAMNLSVTQLGLGTASLATADGARNALTSIDTAMSTLNTTLGDIGANQNRLENTMSNLKTTILNFTAAESVVRDLDMAEEMMKFSKNNILAQAATSMLAQANQSSQGILQLLRG